MDWLEVLGHYCAAIHDEYLERVFQLKLAGAKIPW